MADTETVTLVDSADAADAASRRLADVAWLAIDTEFHAERRYRPELLLVQVRAPDGTTWLLDPLAEGVLARVADALKAAPAWLLHAGFQDLRLMRDALGGLPARVWDTQLGAGLVDVAHPAGFDALCDRWLGVDVDKRARLSDWTRRPLAPEQQRYAAADVRWLPGLVDALRDQAGRLGRLDAWAAACDEAREDALADDPLPTALRRAIAGAELDEDELAVLRELVGWREAEAAAQDRPPSHVLGDAMLKELARAAPTTLADLHANRRLSERTLQRHGRALLEAVARGRDADRSTLPRLPRRHAASGRRVAFLEALAAAVAPARHLAASLVLPRDRIDTLATLEAPDRGDVRRALGAWRDDLVGDVVSEALQGGIGLSAIAGEVVLTPLPRS